MKEDRTLSRRSAFILWHLYLLLHRLPTPNSWPPCPQTYTSSILIAVNPFVRLPALYHPILRSSYHGAALGELSPHVFAVADHAYR